MNEELKEKTKKDYLLPASILLSALIVTGGWVYTTGIKSSGEPALEANISGAEINQADLEEKVMPGEGIVLPVNWANLGAEMIKAGVIDAPRFEAIYSSRGGLNEEMKQLLYGENNGQLRITPENSGYVLNLLWALGLGNRNDILEKGEMADPRYEGAGNFASTGGWTLARGDAMSHYSKHKFIVLTAEEQALVDRVSRNIYRPCCDNSTHFPDCNHGMAMFGLLELLASQGVSEEEMYKIALQVNAYWFPSQYLTIANYLAGKGIAWENADPKTILGVNFSSGSGFKQVLSETKPADKKSGGGCGV